MTPEERDLIAGLADRLRTADTGTKDREADDFIRDIVARQPSAPYLLVQTVLVQEHALANAQTRIAALEREVSELQARSRETSEAQGSGSGGVGSFLSGLLGRPSSPPPVPAGAAGASSDRPRAGGVPPPLPRVVPLSQQGGGQQPYGAGPGRQQHGGQGYPPTMNMPPSAGGGFLRGALATAAGVAGGAMLFQGLQGLMGQNAGLFGGSSGSGGNPGGSGGGQAAGADASQGLAGNNSGDTGGANGGNDASGAEAESHSDALRQSSEPVNESGGDAGAADQRYAETGDFGNDASTDAGGNDYFADSGDSYDSYDGGGDGGGDFV